MDIYTVGHSNYKIEYFINLLNQHNIKCIVDVRSIPYSKYVPHFNETNLKKILKIHNIIYLFMGKELGARRNNQNFYTNGFLNFEKVSTEDLLFQKGISRLKDGMKKGFKISLMCSEKDPIDCHRNILVAKHLFEKEGVNINNIKENGLIESQMDIEKRLLEKYFYTNGQLSMFNKLSEKDMIKKSYLLRNKEIAFTLDKLKKTSL